MRRCGTWSLAGAFGFNNGFDDAFASNNDDGFVDSGNPATGLVQL